MNNPDIRKLIPHPDADPDCIDCGGGGWRMVNFYNHKALVRCETCFRHGPNDSRTMPDKDVVPYSHNPGIK